MAFTAPRTWTDGELVTAAILNAHIRDNLLAIGNHYKLRKTADQNIASSTTLTDDTVLTFPIAANEVWLVHIMLQVNTGAGGFQRTIAAPAGATGVWNEFYGITAGAPAENSTAIGTAQSNAATFTNEPWWIFGTVVNGATPGFCRLQWAQAASNATNSTVRAMSHLLAHQSA